MDEEQRKLGKKWIDSWKLVGPIMERERLLNLDRRSIAEDMELFNGFFRHSILNNPRSNTSGLIEMQALFRKAKR